MVHLFSVGSHDPSFLTLRFITNKNDITTVGALATLAASTTPTLTLTKGIQNGKKSRKPGDTGSHEKDGILASVIVPKTGRFLVSFRVII